MLNATHVHRHPKFPLYFCGACLLGGCVLFAGAIYVHQDLYTYSVHKEAEERRSNPTKVCLAAVLLMYFCCTSVFLPSTPLALFWSQWQSLEIDAKTKENCCCFCWCCHTLAHSRACQGMLWLRQAEKQSLCNLAEQQQRSCEAVALQGQRRIMELLQEQREHRQVQLPPVPHRPP